MANKKPTSRYIEVSPVDGEGKTYKLGFTRQTVVDLEAEGFDFSDLQSQPMSAMVSFILMAFKFGQPKMSQDACLDVWAQLEDKDALMEALVKLYASSVETLMGNPEHSRMKWKMV